MGRLYGGGDLANETEKENYSIGVFAYIDFGVRGVCTAGINGITVISIHSIEDNQLLSFIKEETAWEGDDGSSYDNEQFAPYLAALGYMKTEEKLEATDSNKQEYGLKAPAYTVSVSYDDGKKFNYNIGKFVDNLGLYISSNSGNSVYLIDVRRARI